jgi:transposase-like protein
MFRPPRCPSTTCPFHAHPQPRFWASDGGYHPKCRNHPVPRFRCRRCGIRFSRQTFRADYRQKKPHLNAPLLRLLVSCVGQRQAAKVLDVARRTVERRAKWLARHAEGFHRNRLRHASLTGPFQLDEMESFEANRFQPLTVPVLIHKRTFFVVDVAVAPLRRKGRLTARQKQRRADHEARHGRRPSHAAPAVRSVLASLLPLVPPSRSLLLESDRKPLYAALGRLLFPRRFRHRTFSATARRDHANPLFPINHTAARLRHFLSRLRRRTWCVSKTRAALDGHLRIAMLWIDYARGITNKTRVTPAQALGIAPRPYRIEELLAWRQDWADTSPRID